MANNNNSGAYSGWLGGYAKSVAGTVSAFTQDILEETRADTQGIHFIVCCAVVSHNKHLYTTLSEEQIFPSTFLLALDIDPTISFQL